MIPIPDLPSIHAIAVMVITVVGLYLFSRDWIPLETTGLGILVVMVLMFYIFPWTFNGIPVKPSYFFLSIFGHEALITICALLAIGKSIEVSGSLQPLVGFFCHLFGVSTLSWPFLVCWSSGHFLVLLLTTHLLL